MTSLTEQLKKGELTEGVYYVLYYGKDTEEVDIYRRVYSLYDDSEVRFTIPQVTEVLAEVPSYKQWQAKLEENQNLKELLKECLPIVSAEIMTWQIRGGEESYKRGQEILTRINTAIGATGEKK